MIDFITLQVSHPHNSIAFTLLSNILSFVHSEASVLPQIVSSKRVSICINERFHSAASSDLCPEVRKKEVHLETVKIRPLRTYNQVYCYGFCWDYRAVGGRDATVWTNLWRLRFYDSLTETETGTRGVVAGQRSVLFCFDSADDVRGAMVCEHCRAGYFIASTLVSSPPPLNNNFYFFSFF